MTAEQLNTQQPLDPKSLVDVCLKDAEELREVLKDADNELDWLDEEVGTCDHSVGVCVCSYWGMRRKMKAALGKESKR